jgi:hypothetical protein
MPGERAAFDAASALAATRMPLGREPETQMADWATETPSSGDDYDRDSGKEASRNVVKTPTGAAGGAKLKPSMLCKKLKKKKQIKQEYFRTKTVEEIQMDRSRPPDRLTSLV